MSTAERMRADFDSRARLMDRAPQVAERLRHEDLLGDVWVQELMDWHEVPAAEQERWLALAESLLS